MKKTYQKSVFVLAIVASLFVPIDSDDEANAQTIVQEHRGRIVTWGPVRRDSNGDPAGFQNGQMSWAEYSVYDNSVVRIIPIQGERAIARATYNAIVQKWFIAKQDYVQNTGLQPFQVNPSKLETLPCNKNDKLAFTSAPSTDSNWLLIADPGYDIDNPGTPAINQLPLCSELILMDSPWSEPETELAENISSVLVDNDTGVIAHQALGGNYFGIETGLFAPVENAGCDSMAGVPFRDQPHDAPGTQVDRFVNCDPSRDLGNRNIWGPIQGVKLNATPGTGTFQNFSTDGHGTYAIPLSFPGLEYLKAYTNFQLTDTLSRLPLTPGMMGAGLLFSKLTEMSIQLVAMEAFRIASKATYYLSAEVRYDVFNPRRRQSGYFLLQSDHGLVNDNPWNYKNYVVDTTTMTVQATFSKAPSSQKDELVPVVLGEGEFTEYDLEALARGDVADEDGVPKNQGLLEQIRALDLMRTDVYIFRESDGRLIGTRQGVSLSSVTAWDNGLFFDPGPKCRDNACLFFSVITRGPGSAPQEEINPNAWGYNKNGEIESGAYVSEALTTTSRTRLGHYQSFVRYGDMVRVVLVNRATGYMGTFRAKVDVRGSGLPQYVQVTPENPDGNPIAEVRMRPPNLRMLVERMRRVKGDEAKDLQIVGADGAAITDDEWLQVTTEWYDEDGGPLPDNLPGFTGRLARVVGDTLIAGTADENPSQFVGQFDIKPGKHLVNVQIPQNGELARNHFYIHVSGATSKELAVFNPSSGGDDRPDFHPNQICTPGINSSGESEWSCVYRPTRDNLEQRPALFVPFMVPRFDKKYTKSLLGKQIQVTKDAWEQGDPVPVIDDIDSAYRWIYSPEMQFSIYDLNVREVSLSTSLGEDDAPATDFSTTYDLTGPNSENLARPGHVDEEGKEADIYWGVGYDKIEATLGSGSVSEWSDRATPSDHMGLDLFVDGDEDNTLYELDHIALLYGYPKPLRFERVLRTSDCGGSAQTDKTDSTELLQVVATREVDLEVSVEFGPEGSETVVSLWPASVRRGKGEYFIPLAYQDFIDAGLDPVSEPEFTLLIRATNSDDPNHSHTIRYGGTLTEIREDQGEGMSLDGLGKIGKVANASGLFSDTAGGGSVMMNPSWANGGASLTDGSLRLQRDDFGVPSVGPELALQRTYSNLATTSSESTLGVGWSHGLDIVLTPISLEGDDQTAVPGWFGNLRSRYILERQDFESGDYPSHWGEVLVQGVRFKRHEGSGWLAERGFQGTLEEVGDEFHYTDPGGTVYVFPIPKIPLPYNDIEPEPLTEAPEPSLEDRLIHRIYARDVEADMNASDMDMGPDLDAGTSSDAGSGGTGGGSGEESMTASIADPTQLGKPQTVRVKRIIAPNRQELVFSYDEAHPERVQEIEDTFGRTMAFTYLDCTQGPCITTSAADSRLQQVVLRDAQDNPLFEVGYTYTAEGYLKEANFEGRIEKYTYANETSGGVSKNLTETSMTPDGSEWLDTVYTYYDEGALQTTTVEGVPIRYYEVISNVTYPERAGEPSSTITYTYGRRSSDGLLERRITDARGEETSYILNCHGNPIEVHEPLGRVKRITWEVDHTTATGNAITSMAQSYGVDASKMRRVRFGYDYDALGRLTATWSCDPEILDTAVVMGDAAGSMDCPRNDAAEETTFEPQFGAPTTYTDRNGKVETWAYNPDGTIASNTDTAGVTTLFTYFDETSPLRGLKKTEELPGYFKTTLSYDAYGHVATKSTEVSIPFFGFRLEASSMAHDARGWLLSQTNALGDTTTFEYDARGNVTHVIKPFLNDCPSVVLPADGPIGAKCSGTFSTYATYDLMDRTVSETDIEGLTSSYAYTAKGQLQQATRSFDNHSMFFQHDSNGNVVFMSDWVSGLASAQLQENHSSTSFDALNRPISYTNRLGDVATTTYDHSNRVVERTDFEGTKTYLEYDALDRNITRCVSEPCDAAVERVGSKAIMTYYDGEDPGKNLRTITRVRGYGLSDVTTEFFYDDGYRLIRRLDPSGREHTWNFDAAGYLLDSNDEEGRERVYSMDGVGRVWKIVQTGDAGDGLQSREVSLERDLLGRVVRSYGPYVHKVGTVTLPMITTQGFDPWGRMTEISVLEYDENDQLLNTLTSEYAYDGKGRVVWGRKPDGAITRASYDLLGRVTRTEGAEGEIQDFLYDAESRVIEHVVPADPNWNTPELRTCFTYDAEDTIIQQRVGADDCNLPIQPHEKVSLVLQKNAMGITEKAQDPSGRILEYTHDAVYRTIQTQVRGTDGQTLLPGPTTLYNAGGLVVRVTDPLGNKNEYDYDLLDRTVSSKFTGAGATPLIYEEFWDHTTSDEITHTNREGLITKRLFNDFGQLVEVQVDGTTRWSGSYDVGGKLIEETDARGNSKAYSYDYRGLLEEVSFPEINGLVATQQYHYDENERLIEVIDMLGHSATRTYDDSGRVTEMSYQGETTTMSYDTQGHVVEVVPPRAQPGQAYAGQAVRHYYDAFGRLTSINEFGLTTTYEYDELDSLTRLIGPNNQEQLWSYDIFGRVKEHKRLTGCPASLGTQCDNEPTELITTWDSYDAVGNPTSITDPLNQTRTMTYDPIGRLQRIDFEARADQVADTAVPNWMEIEYDEFHRPTKTTLEKTYGTNPAAQTVFEQDYDLLGRMDWSKQTHRWYESTTLEQRDVTIDYAYDVASNLTCLSTSSLTGCQTPGAQDTLYEYDARSRMSAVLVGSDRTEVGYDNANRLKSLNYLTNGITTEFAYQDENNPALPPRLSSLEHLNGANTLAEFNFTYFHGGQIQAETRQLGADPLETRTYSYDVFDRLVEQDVVRGAYNERREFTFTGYQRSNEKVYQDGHLEQNFDYVYDYAQRLRQREELVQNEVETLDWDANGNLVEWVGPNATKTFSYNALNQLVESKKTPDAGSGQSTIKTSHFDYDITGMRIRSTNITTGTQDFTAYLGSQVLLRWRDGQTTPERYHHGPTGLFGVTNGSDKGYFHKDVRGTVLGLSDVTGAFVGEQRFDPWGRPLEEPTGSGALVEQTFGYTGHEHEKASELIYMKARFYEPTLGVFLSEDPVFGSASDPRSMLKHLYAHGDPVNRFDPSGQSTAWIGQHDNTSGGLPQGFSDASATLQYNDFNWAAHAAYQSQASKWASQDRLSALQQFNAQFADPMANILVAVIDVASAVKQDLDTLSNGKVTLAEGLVIGMASRMVDAAVFALFPKLVAAAVVGGIIAVGYMAYKDPSGTWKLLTKDIKAVHGALSGGPEASAGAYWNLGLPSLLSNSRLLRAAYKSTLRALAGKTKGLRKLFGGAASKLKSRIQQARQRLAHNKKSKPCPSCFVGETPVRMCDGTIKPIEQVDLGDEVWSRDEITGEEGCKEVDGIHTNTISWLYELELEDIETGERETYRVSGAHPFITPTGDQIVAIDLEDGQVLGGLGERTWVVVSRQRLDVSTVVYNLSVETFHTYFVGELGVWVHNCDEVIANRVLEQHGSKIVVNARQKYIDLTNGDHTSFLKQPYSKGAWRISAHGQRDGMSIGAALDYNKPNLSPRELAALMRTNGYKKDELTILFSCNTGACDNGYAARLASELDGPVLAPGGYHISMNYDQSNSVSSFMKNTYDSISVKTKPPKDDKGNVDLSNHYDKSRGLFLNNEGAPWRLFYKGEVHSINITKDYFYPSSKNPRLVLPKQGMLRDVLSHLKDDAGLDIGDLVVP